MPSRILHMRRPLDTPIPQPEWPPDIFLSSLIVEVSQQVHDLLTVSYQDTGITIAAYSDWWPALVCDSEFDPQLCFLVWDADDLVAVAQCWTTGFIKDFVVHPRRRNQGLGESLLLHVFNIFKQRSADTVELKVHNDNLPAIALYKKMGMQPIDNLIG